MYFIKNHWFETRNQNGVNVQIMDKVYYLLIYSDMSKLSDILLERCDVYSKSSWLSVCVCVVASIFTIDSVKHLFFITECCWIEK